MGSAFGAWLSAVIMGCLAMYLYWRNSKLESEMEGYAERSRKNMIDAAMDTPFKLLREEREELQAQLDRLREAIRDNLDWRNHQRDCDRNRVHKNACNCGLSEVFDALEGE